MSRRHIATTLAGLSILWCAATASAETLRCQSVNGNVNCTGSGGYACQTVNGHKVCTSGHGDVVQSFGGADASGWSGQAVIPGDDGTGSDEAVPEPMVKPRGDHDRSLWLQQDGMQLHIRTGQFSIDRE
jgi:hypothetical protein